MLDVGTTKTILAPLVAERRRAILEAMATTSNSATVDRKSKARQALAALDALEKWWTKASKPAAPKPEPIAGGAHGENPSGQVDEATQEEQVEAAPTEGTAEAPKVLNNGGGQTTNKDISLYNAVFKRLTRALFRGRVTEFEFVDNLFTSMRQNFLDAWQEGRDAVKAGPMTDEDRLRVQDIVAEQAQYAPGFAQYVRSVAEGGGKFGDLLPRAQMWVSKYQEVRAEAMVSARGEQRLRWKVNPKKEHCEDCVALDGRIYSAKTWEKYNLRPRSHSLACKGYKCGCEFVPTNAPASKGRPPVDLRGKSLEEMVYKFDPSQPRDETGKWSNGGDGVSAGGKLNTSGSLEESIEGYPVVKSPAEYFMDKTHSDEELIGRAFSNVPNPDDFGHYELDRIVSENSLVTSREPADFGSLGTVEWGYGPYAVIFGVPKSNVYKTDTSDYDIERAFSVESARPLAIALNASQKDKVDLGRIKRMRDDNDWNVPIIWLKPIMRARGWSTEIKSLDENMIRKSLSEIIWR